MNTPLALQALEALEGMLSLDRENNQRGHDDEDVCIEVRQADAAVAALRSHIDQPAAREPLSDSLLKIILMQLGFTTVDSKALENARAIEAAVLKVLSANDKGFPASEGWAGIHHSNGAANDT
jgi:hypothetical protein